MATSSSEKARSAVRQHKLTEAASKKKATVRVIKRDTLKEVKITEVSTGEELTSNWQDRFVKRVYEDPAQLLPHELNYKVHPRYQQAAMEGALDELGWLDEVKADINSGRVFNGHMRCEIAITKGERVPVSYYDLTPSELERALLTFDPLQDLAIRQKDKYRDLVDANTVNDKSLQALVDHVAGKASIHAGNATSFLDGYASTAPSDKASSSDPDAPDSRQLTAEEFAARVSSDARAGLTEAGGLVSVDGAASAAASPELIKVLFMFSVEDKKILFAALNEVKEREALETHGDALMSVIRFYAAQ